MGIKQPNLILEGLTFYLTSIDPHFTIEATTKTPVEYLVKFDNVEVVKGNYKVISGFITGLEFFKRSDDNEV